MQLPISSLLTHVYFDTQRVTSSLAETKVSNFDTKFQALINTQNVLNYV